MEILRQMLDRVPVRSALALGLGATILTGCGESPEILPNRPATVIDQEYHEDYVTLLPAGKVLVPQFHPEEFHLELRQCDRSQDEFADESGCVTAHIEVDQETYESHPVGSSITFEES